MIDHDQIFKIVLRCCLRDFFRAFLPEWEPRFDFDAADWLDKEVFENPPQGKRRFADLVVKLPLRIHPGGEWTTMLCLIHIEIESDASQQEMRRRMYVYYRALRDRHPDIPVLPIAIYMNLKLDGVGSDVYEETLFGRTILRFEFHRIALKGLDAQKYVDKSIPVAAAMASLMDKDETDLRLRADAAAVIAGLPEGRDRMMLCEFAETYWPLGDEQRAEYDRLTQTEEFAEVRAMQMTTFQRGRLEGEQTGRLEGEQKGRLEGEQRGKLEGRLELLRDMLQERFGPLDAGASARLRAMSDDAMRDLGKRLLRASSLKELGLAD